MTGDRVSTDFPKQVIKALRQALGADQFFAKLDESRSLYVCHYQHYLVLLLWDTAAVGHKYVSIEDSFNHYLVALPLSLIELHKEIVELLTQLTGHDKLECSGGGYLKFENERLIAYGSSQAFGDFNHAIAQQAFQSAFQRSD